MSNVLAVGAHPDDLELGCFGSLCLHKKNGDKLFGLIMTNGEKGGNPELRKKESTVSAKAIGMELEFGNFSDGYLPNNIDVISLIENVIEKHEIDIVYTTSTNDRHQDHRNIGLSVQVSARNVSEVYAYETTSCTNEFNPILYVDITSVIDSKRDCLKKHVTQEHRVYVKNYDVYNKYRALRINAIENYYEAFEVLKIVR